MDTNLQLDTGRSQLSFYRLSDFIRPFVVRSVLSPDTINQIRRPFVWYLVLSSGCYGPGTRVDARHSLAPCIFIFLLFFWSHGAFVFISFRLALGQVRIAVQRGCTYRKQFPFEFRSISTCVAVDSNNLFVFRL